MFKSIRWRLVASHVSLTLLTVSVAGLLGLWGMRYTARQQEIQYLTNTARAISQRAEPLISTHAETAQVTQLAQTAAFFGNVQVRILDAEGHLIADSGGNDGPNETIWFMMPYQVGMQPSEPPLRGFFIAPAPVRIPILETGNYPLPEDLGNLKVTIIRRVHGPWGGRFEMEPLPGERTGVHVQEIKENSNTRRSRRTIRVPIGASQDPIGVVELRSLSDSDAGAMASSWLAFILAASGSIALALALGLFLGGRLSKPITNLNQTALKMGSGELSVRAPVQGKDEIGELAEQFNSMASQLETSFSQLAMERDTLRRFIADASHELRTPITALQNFNELLLDSASDDLHARTEFLKESKLQIERMAWITQNLLDLSRLESGISTLDLAPHEAGEILDDLRKQFETQAAEKSIQLEIDKPETSLVIRCDLGRLEMALSNLLDNALKFAPESGKVSVGVDSDEMMVRFSFVDNGPGIHPDDLPHLFERFYRGRNSDHAGSGLGLSIVQSVAQAHNGRVWVESELKKGSKFILEIPSWSKY